MSDTEKKPPVYQGLDEFTIAEASGYRTLVKNGIPCACPLIPPIYVPGKLSGSYEKVRETCNSNCPRFSFGKKTFEDKSEMYVVRQTCMGSNVEFVLANVVELPPEKKKSDIIMN